MYNYLMATKNFPNWLMEQLRSKNLKQVDIAKRSGLSTAHIVRLLSGERQPGADALVAIARALRIPPTEVFQAAGIFENPNKKLDRIEALAYKISMLPPSQQKLIDSIIETILSQPSTGGNLENKEVETP